MAVAFLLYFACIIGASFIAFVEWRAKLAALDDNGALQEVLQTVRGDLLIWKTRALQAEQTWVEFADSRKDGP